MARLKTIYAVPNVLSPRDVTLSDINILSDDYKAMDEAPFVAKMV